MNRRATSYEKFFKKNDLTKGTVSKVVYEFEDIYSVEDCIEIIQKNKFDKLSYVEKRGFIYHIFNHIWNWFEDATQEAFEEEYGDLDLDNPEQRSVLLEKLEDEREYFSSLGDDGSDSGSDDDSDNNDENGDDIASISTDSLLQGISCIRVFQKME